MRSALRPCLFCLAGLVATGCAVVLTSGFAAVVTSGSAATQTVDLQTGSYSFGKLAPALVNSIGFQNSSFELPGMAQSPANAAPGDVSEQFTAPNGQTVIVTVKSPVTSSVYNAPPLAIGENPVDYFNHNIAKAGNGATLLIPQGIYNFPALVCATNQNSHVVLNGKSDLVIDGQGSTLNFTSDCDGIAFYGAMRILLKNFSLNWPNLNSAAVATISAVAPTQISLQLPAGSGLDSFTSWGLWDAAHNYWGLNRPFAYNAYYGTTEIPFSASGLATNVPRGTAPLSVGQQVVARNNKGFHSPAILVSNKSQDISFQNVTVYAAPAIGFLVLQSRGVHLNNCAVTRWNNNPISTTIDAVHIASTGGDIIIENSSFAYQGDDGLNINTELLPIAAQPNCVGSAANCPYALATMVTFPSGNISQALPGSDGDIIALFDPTMKLIGNQTVSCPSGACSANVAPIAATGGYIANVSLASARYIIRNNLYFHNTANGARLSTSYGLVQNNVFVGQSMGAILLAASNFWGEGPGAQDVLVLGNRFVSLGAEFGEHAYGAVAILREIPNAGANGQINYVAAKLPGLPPVPPVNQNLVFAFNQFVDLLGPAFYVSNANNVLLYGNQFDRTNLVPIGGSLGTLPMSGDYPVIINDSSNVQLIGNRATGTGRPILAVPDPNTTSSILLH